MRGSRWNRWGARASAMASACMHAVRATHDCEEYRRPLLIDERDFSATPQCACQHDHVEVDLDDDPAPTPQNDSHRADAVCA